MARQEGVTIGPYRVVEQVGLGGMATVYKAYQPSMERYVALKILPQHYARDASFVQRFIREARTIANLEHRNILPVYDFGEQDGVTYLAMRFLEGGTLKDILQLGRLTLSDASELLSQIAAALDYAHRQGVIHRDVKPANIMVDNEGWAYLTDFGIAKALEGTSDLTQGAIGTPAYMAPEQSMGQGVDARTDIYALGIILYEMVTGRVPYEADTPMAVALAHVHSPLPMPREIDPNIPEPIEQVILKAVAKEPADRYQTAGEFATALREAINEAEVDASQTHIQALANKARESFVSQSQQITQDDFAPIHPSTQPAPQPDRPKRWPLMVGILAAIVIIGGIIAALFLTGVLPGKQVSTIVTPTPGSVDEALEQEQPSAATPHPTTDKPAPTANPISDVPLYDDFNTSGSGLGDKWDFLAESAPECIVERADGAGIFSNQSSEEFMVCTTVANRGQVSLDSFGFMEADFYIAEDASGNSANLEMEMFTGDIEGNWLAACGLQSTGTYHSAFMYIEQQEEIEPEYWEDVEISAQEWHRIRLEADPITAEISCYVDDRLIGRHLPKQADLLQEANFAYELVSWYEPGVTGTLWVDNVQIPAENLADENILFRDDFDSATLNDSWYWVREEAASWNLTDQPGALTFMTSNTSLSFEGGDSPLLLRSAPGGDFELRTKLDLSPTQNYQAAFITIYQDDDHQVSLGRAYCEPSDTCVGDGAYLDDDYRFMTEGFFPNNVGGLPAGPFYLRLVKNGDTYTGLWSADGENWNLVAETTATISSPRVGISTSNGRTGADSIPAVFDFFEIRKITE